jgi:hypothetical protein
MWYRTPYLQGEPRGTKTGHELMHQGDLSYMVQQRLIGLVTQSNHMFNVLRRQLEEGKDVTYTVDNNQRHQ